MGKTKRGNGSKMMAIAAGNSVPLAVTIYSASPHEFKLVDETLSGSFLNELAARLIGDKAYDSDPLDRHLDEEYGIEMIAPTRQNRSQTQDSRTLRRYKRCWVVSGGSLGCNGLDWLRAPNFMPKTSLAWSASVA